jgi:glycosyltransferase involved in cell wall biosynthesis
MSYCTEIERIGCLFCHLDQRPVKWINKFHEKRALNTADACFSVSQFTADTTNVFHLDKKFSIIPNCIDTNLFSNDVDSSSNDNSILYFGV